MINYEERIRELLVDVDFLHNKLEELYNEVTTKPAKKKMLMVYPNGNTCEWAYYPIGSDIEYLQKEFQSNSLVIEVVEI